MTQVAEFKVAHLYPPYQGRGLAKIVAHDGTKYSCQESQLGQFKEGENVAIHYTDESFTSKKTGETVAFKKFVSKVPQTNGGTAPKQYNRPSASPRDSEQIWCTAHSKSVIAMFIGDDLKLNRAAFTQLTNDLRACYAATLGGVQAQTRDDLDDAIPF